MYEQCAISILVWLPCMRLKWFAHHHPGRLSGVPEFPSASGPLQVSSLFLWEPNLAPNLAWLHQPSMEPPPPFPRHVHGGWEHDKERMGFEARRKKKRKESRFFKKGAHNVTESLAYITTVSLAIRARYG